MSEKETRMFRFTCVLITCCFVTIAQGNDDLPGAEAWGVGSAYRARADGIAAFNWNPGGIGWTSRFEMQAHPTQDAVGIAFGLPYGLGAIGMMAQGLDVPTSLSWEERLDVVGLTHERNTELTVGYGRQWQDQFSVGLAGIYRRFDSSSKTNLGYHLGLLFIPHSSLRFGLDLRDVAVDGDETRINFNYFKQHAHASLAWQTGEFTTFSLDSTTETAAIGIELAPSIARLRAGALIDFNSNVLNPRWTIGFGIHYSFLQIDYAYRQKSFEREHVMSVGIRFEPKRPRVLEYLPLKLHVPEKFTPSSEIDTPVAPDIPEIPKPLLTLPEPSYDIDLFLTKTERYPVDTHIVSVEVLRKGMTLSHITNKYTDKLPKRYRDPYELGRYNGISDPRSIPADTKIKVPLSARAVRGTGGFEEAFERLKQEYKQNPANLAIINNLAVLHIERNEIDDARNLLERVVKAQPEVSPPYVNLGLIHLIRNEHESAKKSLNKAIELNPGSANAYCNLGLAYLSSDEIPKAIEALNQAIEIDERHADARYNLAMAFNKDNQPEEALYQLQELIRLWPEDTDVLRGIERIQKGSEQ